MHRVSSSQLKIHSHKSTQTIAHANTATQHKNTGDINNAPRWLAHTPPPHTHFSFMPSYSSAFLTCFITLSATSHFSFHLSDSVSHQLSVSWLYLFFFFLRKDRLVGVLFHISVPLRTSQSFPTSSPSLSVSVLCSFIYSLQLLHVLRLWLQLMTIHQIDLFIMNWIVKGWFGNDSKRS